jgi:hypothetical protein
MASSLSPAPINAHGHAGWNPLVRSARAAEVLNPAAVITALIKGSSTAQEQLRLGAAILSPRCPALDGFMVQDEGVRQEQHGQDCH